MKLISVMQNGRRVDIPIEKFQKMLEETKESIEKVEKKDEESQPR